MFDELLKIQKIGNCLRPGLLRGAYPEKKGQDVGWLDSCGHGLQGLFNRTLNSRYNHCAEVVAAINMQGKELIGLAESDILEQLAAVSQQLRQQGLDRALIIQAFALIREMAQRTLGMRHYDSQLMGGWIMIQGRVAELDTGEGKTLTATLAAATAALAGIPVHVITVNEYLVCRDAETMAPLYQALGLTVGTVTAAMDSDACRAAYDCDITYCTNKQVAFDYLRDRMVLDNEQGHLRRKLAVLSDDSKQKPLLRGLCFAIIDEADSVLIDEARTPLLLSKEIATEDENKLYRTAMFFASQLEVGLDYTIDMQGRSVALSDKGSQRLAEISAEAGGVWAGQRRRQELACQALVACELYHRDRHYLLTEGKVVIIDENTGRPMADRSWQRGLHQMIEIKEKCTISSQRQTLARLTYQRFFRRYLRLAGMSGTVNEVSGELWSVYDLQVQRVATHRPCCRLNKGVHVLADRTSKWQAVIKQVVAISSAGRPVLIGTRSLADSEHVSALLTLAGIKHQVLNARQDAHEAEIIALAGQPGQITVATNMAGRGTDIPLGAGVAAAGGLHVIATEQNEALRIDRQLFGRCGRQGDPGSYECILSLNDELLQQQKGRMSLDVLALLLVRKYPLIQKISHLALRGAQFKTQQHHKRLRRNLLQLDKQLGRRLAFSGSLE